MDLEKEGIQISIFRQFRIHLLRQLTDAREATTPPKAAKELSLPHRQPTCNSNFCQLFYLLAFF